jgi:superfamily I DNA/RNA helicase
MAKIFPSLEDLMNTNFKRAKPSIHELEILKFFHENLNDSYEIYFRPFLNGLRPFAILFREKSGILIIDYYSSFLEIGKLAPNKKYDYQKFEIIDLILSPEEKKINQKSLLTTIHGVCIINETKAEITKKYSEVKFYTFFSYNTFFDIGTFEYFLSRSYLKNDSIYYVESCFKELRRYLKPSLHTIEEGKEFYPNLKQKNLIISKTGDQRVKGVAGTGKTSVLAQRAVCANERTNSEVLILSFNITIRHYIRHKIESVRKEYLRTDFHLSHYHDFFKNQSIQFLNEKPQIHDWESINYFDKVKDKIKKYSTIIIDEAQDYKREWVEILKKYFLEIDGEFVIYFDSNQDIYHRKSLDSFPIKGRPNELNKSYRLSTDISKLTKKFYNEFFETNEPFDIEVEPNTLNFNEFRENISYRYFDNNFNHEDLYNYIKIMIQLSNSNPDDIAVVGTSINLIREIEHYFRIQKKEKTTRMFESQEEYDNLIEETSEGEQSIKFKMKLKDLRREYKLHKFNLTTGTMKFSSLHSFKGWEIHTLFLIISETTEGQNKNFLEEQDDTFINHELIYTGITRARNNLNIINIGVDRYNDFFVKSVNEGIDRQNNQLDDDNIFAY